MNFEEYNVLGNIIEDMFGSAVSDSNGSFKIVSKIVSEDKMKITCMQIVNLLTRSEMKRSCDKAYEQCEKAINEHLKLIKKEFKAAAGRALKVKKLGSDQSTELVNMSAYNEKGTALVRCVCSFDIK